MRPVEEQRVAALMKVRRISEAEARAQLAAASTKTTKIKKGH